MVLTLSAVADHKKIVLEELEVEVGYVMENGLSSSTRFIVKINFANGLSQREQTILFNSARRCEVGKTLSAKIDFEVT